MEEQTGVTLSFIYPAGLQRIRLTIHGMSKSLFQWKLGVNIYPISVINVANCLDDNERAFVLLDMYDLLSPAIYDFEDEAIKETRSYHIAITAKWEKGEFLLRVDGILELIKQMSNLFLFEQLR